MYTTVYWVPRARGRLGILPRPRGGDWLDDEVQALRDAGVDVLVSLLTAEEKAELDLDREADLCTAANIEFVSVPLPDREVPPSAQALLELVRSLAARLAGGETVTVHCRQGVGRAGMVAACLLIRSGMTPDAAFDAVGTARGRPVPDTPEQRAWVVGFAQSLSQNFPEETT